MVGAVGAGIQAHVFLGRRTWESQYQDPDIPRWVAGGNSVVEREVAVRVRSEPPDRGRGFVGAAVSLDGECADPVLPSNKYCPSDERFLPMPCHGKHQSNRGAMKHAETAARTRGTTSEIPDVDVTLNINGESYRLRFDSRVTLLDALRDHLGLTGAKKGCDQGACGACTVLVDGKRIVACLALAAQYEGREITTIEGLAENGEPHPMQEAFARHDAFQCGYCTPGQIMSAVSLMAEGRAGTDDDICEYMSGNICRCGAYPNIRAAIREVVTEGNDASL
ncbi:MULTISPECIES: (2Fe-2S)-binding protein [Streptomyces]|uniref:(2Fe-2S)-binding protein n=1 Tax=Streptomyces TaxID=1883 RepID=UPI000A7C4EFF|nr:(2Fe-2S)-binding protein [Streptomyces sp. AS58]